MSLPNHIAIIPDGNRRWAKAQGLPAFMGHREGAKTTEKILTEALNAGVSHLTFWGVSISNITKRESKEVQFLFKLFTTYFKKIAKAKLIHKHKVHINVFGEWEKYFPKETQVAIQGALTATKDYTGFRLTFLLAYSGIDEMVKAVQGIVDETTTAHRGGESSVINAGTIKQHLYTKDLPPVDLAIRTGGDPHLSTGFMMWDLAEAQLYFSNKMWPEFSVEDFHRALEVYGETERRLGK